MLFQFIKVNICILKINQKLKKEQSGKFSENLIENREKEIVNSITLTLR